VSNLDWPGIWYDVARRVAAHRDAGRGHLLTEDIVRLESVLALEHAGVAASRMRSEVFVPQLTGGKLDLVVDPPDGAVIELKYPRSSATGISPDTMTFGELVRDFLRVAVVPARDRWVVQVLEDRLARYIRGICGRHALTWATAQGERLVLPAAALGTLPRTAIQAIGAATAAGTITATCAVVAPVGDALTLYAHAVDAAAAGAIGPSATLQPPAALPPSTPAPANAVAQRATRDGARREILDAARAVVTRTGRNGFSMADVVAEMHSRGTGYADTTIRTMVGAHLCADTSGDGVAGYTDLTRIGRGLYKLTDWQSA
jgi:hypothetical protein